MMKQIDWANPIHKTFVLHLIYSILTGFLEGSFYMSEFVLIKSLRGSNYHVAYLFQFSIVILIFSVVTNQIIKRYANKMQMIRILALITNLPLVLLVLFPHEAAGYGGFQLYQLAFLGIFLVHFSARPILFPVITAVLKSCYGSGRFGKMYGYATTFNKGAILVSTFIFGILLDIDPFVFIYFYPVIGVLGLVAVWTLSFVPYENTEAVLKQPLLQSIKYSMRNMWRIIKENKPFRDFEIGFMLYGIAWMLTMALVTIFFERVLGLNYTSFAFYKNAYNILAILILPFFSRMIDRIDPRKFGMYTFSSLLIHIFFMGLTEYFPQHFEIWGITIYYSLILSYTSYAVFAATMGLLWNIGSAYFCRDDEASHYQSVHLSMVGFRALFAPLAGVWLLDYFGFFPVFLLGMLFLAAAIGLMYWSMKKRPIN